MSVDSPCLFIQGTIRAACASVTLLALCAFGLAAEATEDAKPKDVATVEAQLQHTQIRLQELEAQLAENKSRKASLEQAISGVSERVEERATRLQQLAGDIKQYNGTLQQLETRVRAEQENLLKRKESLAESLRRQQHLAQSVGLRVVLQHDDPSKASRLGVYSDYFLQAQNREITAQIAVIEKIEAAHAVALKDRNWLNHIQRKASSQHQAFVQERGVANAELDTVDTDIQTKSKTVAELKADNARLQTLMDELKALQVADSGYFQAGQGSYSMPVKGRIAARFDDAKSVGKVRWKGLYITAPMGSPVHAIADGEVVYSDWLQGFGRLIIVDHGDSFMTLYGGNRQVLVTSGDWVDTGHTIATVGQSSGQKETGLYFEIRHDAKPIDPEQWVKSPNKTIAAKK